ncbi:MAG: hypothetical protein B7Z83_02035 [Thiomonas sp. 20-64-5]|nr:MAG: hypothetical protein B7Z83_02035 [Thiomonas sp. 20-64-5]
MRPKWARRPANRPDWPPQSLRRRVWAARFFEISVPDAFEKHFFNGLLDPGSKLNRHGGSKFHQHEQTFQAGDYLSPSATAPVGTPWAVLRHMEGFPARMRKPELTGLFRAMQKAGHIRREGYTKPNRHPGERWAITAAGYAFAGIAAPAEQEPKTHARRSDG